MLQNHHTHHRYKHHHHPYKVFLKVQKHQLGIQRKCRYIIQQHHIRLQRVCIQSYLVLIHQQDNQQNAIEVRKQLLRLHNELEGEMLADEPQEATVVELTDKIGQLRTELQVERARTQLAVRELLTPEQRDKMMMLKATHRGAGKHGRHGGEGRWAGRRAGRCGGGCGGGYAGGYAGHGPHGTGTAECDGDGPKGPHGRGGQDRDR